MSGLHIGVFHGSGRIGAKHAAAFERRRDQGRELRLCLSSGDDGVLLRHPSGGEAANDRQYAQAEVLMTLPVLALVDAP